MKAATNVKTPGHLFNKHNKISTKPTPLKISGTTSPASESPHRITEPAMIPNF